MLVAALLFLMCALTSVEKETLGTFTTISINTGSFAILEYGSDRELSYLSAGSPLNGLVVGRNKYGFYGRAACFGKSTQWGSWL